MSTQPVIIDVTTEVRWFFAGALPAAVDEWFAPDWSALTEERSDVYRLSHEVDCGVKRRGGTMLELKERLGPASVWRFGDEATGHLESWRRWSPADDRVVIDSQSAWVDVGKHIVKSRFDTDGSRVSFSGPDLPIVGEGCDAEITTISIAGQQGWSFALASFGPVDGHRQSLDAAWRALAGQGHLPGQLQLDRTNSCGYPEWISRVLRLDG